MHDHLSFAKQLAEDEAFRERVNTALIALGRITEARDEEMLEALMADPRIEVPEDGKEESLASNQAFAEVFNRVYDERISALIEACGSERNAMGYMASSLARAMNDAMTLRMLKEQFPGLSVFLAAAETRVHGARRG